MQEQEMTIDRTQTNRECLKTLREIGTLLDGDSLALKVDEKIEAGLPLTPVEAGILWHGITEEHAQFVKQHLL